MMKQAYRRNAREEVLRARYPDATTTLEELACHPVISFSGDPNECEDDIRAKVQRDIANQELTFVEQKEAEIDAYKAECEALPQRAQAIEDTLTDLGFEKDTLDDYLVYVRRIGKDMEILTDCALHREDKQRDVCLYRVPLQDVNEWYTNLPVRTYQAGEKENRARLVGIGSIIGSIGPIIGSIYALEAYGVGLLLLSMAVMLGGMGASLAFTVKYEKQFPVNNDLAASGYENGAHKALLEAAKLPEEDVIDSLNVRVEEFDHKELAAKDPEALQYIAGTPFEDVLRFDASPIEVRVDVSEYTEQEETILEEPIESSCMGVAK